MADDKVDIGVSGYQPIDQRLISGAELLRQNRIPEAREELQAALEIQPDNAKALGLLGLACFRMDDFASALPVYQKLVSLSRNDASFALNLGLVHLKLGDAAAAIEQLERSRELDPSQGRAVSYLGLAYARMGAYDKAYQAFLQAGEGDLAREMEQYLSDEQREQIKAALAAPKRSEVPPEGYSNAALEVPAADADAPADASADAGAEYDDVEVIPEPEVVVVEAESAVAEPASDPEHSADAEDIEEVSAADIEVLSDEDDDLVSGAPDAPVVSGRPPLTEPAQDSAPGTQRPGIISQAVELARPSVAPTAVAARVAVGHSPPQSLTEFATARLVRPEDSEHTFETSVGGVLIIRVRDRVYSRTEGVNVTGGELAYEVASRHSRGSSTGEDFSTDGRHMFIVTGHGHLIASPRGNHFTALSLDEDILYLREDLVFAFESDLRWENGHVPGSNSTIRMVQFRGQGDVAFRSKRPLLAIKLAPERVLYVDAEVLAGWIGRVMPRMVSPAAGGEQSSLFVECVGEGVVLVEDEDEAPPLPAQASASAPELSDDAAETP